MPPTPLRPPPITLPITLLVALLFALAPTAAPGQQPDAPVAELLDGRRSPARLQSIDEQKVRLGAVDGLPLVAKEVRLDGLLRWGAPSAAAPRPTVVLHQGSRLVAAPAWTANGSITLGQRVVTLKQTLLSEAKLPRPLIRTILFQAARDPTRFEAALAEADAHRGADDRVWLVSGDAISGDATAIARGRLTLEVAGEPLEIETTQVALLRLAGEAPNSPPPAVAVGLRDGGLLLGDGITLDGDGRLAIRLTPELTVAGRREGAVTLVQPLRGRVAYLSDQTPIDYRHTPYFDLGWPYARDANLLGGPLRVSGRRSLKGLATHSASRLVYRVDPRFRRFEARIAIDDSARRQDGRGPTGGVVFRVLVAHAGKFALAYESDLVQPSDGPQPVKVDVTGAQALALLVDYGDGSDTLDHADWLNARLVE